MREIKFLAWDKELNMLHDEVVAIDFRIKMIMVFSKSEDDYPSGWLPLDRFELMQYTGFKDKHGKEIYEGYIIKNHTPAGDNHSAYDEIGEVIWDKNRIIAEQKRYGSYFPIIEGHSEIIGNIYDHPKLLV